MSLTAEHGVVELARAAARACGLDDHGAQLVRAAVSCQVVLPSAGVIARVEPPSRRHIAARMVALARAYARCDAPTVRLVAPDQQPLQFPDGAVTLWQLLDGPVATVDDYEQIGALVRRVHEASRELAGTHATPRLDPFVELRPYLASLQADGFDPPTLARLRDHSDRLAARWARVAHGDPLGHVFVHGDLHCANVMLTPTGPVLVDLELGGAGPASWDFAVLAAHVHRYGLPAAMFDDYARGYGADMRDSAQLECFRDVYELFSALWALSCRAQSQEVAAESERRLAGVLDGGDLRWTLL